jgi:hypothetical protein
VAVVQPRRQQLGPLHVVPLRADALRDRSELTFRPTDGDQMRHPPEKQDAADEDGALA